jgi:hypothetical protein
VSTATAIVYESSTTPADHFSHLSRSSLLLGKRCEAEVWLDDPEVWEELLRLLVLHTRVDNDVVTWHPVDGGCDAVLVPRLQAVEDTEDLGRVTTSGRGVGEDEADRLLGVDDEDGADGEGDALAVDVGRVLVVDPGTRVRRVSCMRKCPDLHVVRQRNLALLVADDGELQLAAADLIDVLDPAIVRVDRVGGETDELCAAAGELRLELREGAELGCADGRVVFGVREENHPVVADELVEVDGALGRLGLEVGGLAAQTERLGAVAHGVCGFCADC